MKMLQSSLKDCFKCCQILCDPWTWPKNENSCQKPSFQVFSWDIIFTYNHTMLIQYSNVKNRLSTETTNMIEVEVEVDRSVVLEAVRSEAIEI